MRNRKWEIENIRQKSRDADLWNRCSKVKGHLLSCDINLNPGRFSSVHGCCSLWKWKQSCVTHHHTQRAWSSWLRGLVEGKQATGQRKGRREKLWRKRMSGSLMWHTAVNRSLGRPAGTHKQSCTNYGSVPSVNSSQAHFADLLLQLY